MTPSALALLAAMAAPQASAKEPPPCAPFGSFSEGLPELDPFRHACNDDPFPTEKSYKEAWAGFLKRLKKEAGAPIPDGEYRQRILCTGERRPEDLDERKHWGDLAYVLLTDVDGEWMPSRVFFVTFRAFKDKEHLREPDLEAHRWDFTVFYDGELISLQRFKGVRHSGRADLDWGTSSEMETPYHLTDLSRLRWRQLLKAWIDRDGPVCAGR